MGYVQIWAIWFLGPKIGKCCLMLVNVKLCILVTKTKGDYFMDSVQLETVTDERDLWVIVSDNLKCEKQCVAAVKQSNKILGTIKHNFEETVIALYRSLVRPHLEYCTPVWNLHLVKDIKLLEGVQRRATKIGALMLDLSIYDWAGCLQGESGLI